MIITFCGHSLFTKTDEYEQKMLAFFERVAGIKFAVLRLDWGIQLHNPNKPIGERWIHNFKWENTSLNFGVGYPF